MNLLGITVGPLWWCVVGRELHADSPVARGVEDGMKTFLCEDTSAKHPCPEGTLSRKIRSIEHDNLTHDIHPSIVARLRPAVWSTLLPVN